MTFTARSLYIHARPESNRKHQGANTLRDTPMKRHGHTTLLWTVLIIALVWSVYSATSELIMQVDRLRETLFICGNTWLIQSVI
jgi:hypothetical protein